MEEKDKQEVRKMIRDETKRTYTKRVGDTANDDLQLTSRKYVNLNGVIANRPKAARPGQQYFPTDIGYPIFFNGTSWVNATASVVASS